MKPAIASTILLTLLLMPPTPFVWAQQTTLSPSQATGKLNTQSGVGSPHDEATSSETPASQSISILIGVLQVVTAGLTAFVTYRLYEATVALNSATETLGKISLDSTQAATDALLVNSLNSTNAIVLSSVENLRAADGLFAHDGIDRTEEAIRERWLVFVVLNSQQLLWFETKAGRFSEILQEVSAKQVLDRLLSHDSIVLPLLRERGYHPEFVAYCESRLQAMKTPEEPSETTA